MNQVTPMTVWTQTEFKSPLHPDVSAESLLLRVARLPTCGDRFLCFFVEIKKRKEKKRKHGTICKSGYLDPGLCCAVLNGRADGQISVAATEG